MNDSTHCLTERRRDLVRQKGRNGIDYVEVGDVSGHFGGCAQTQTYLTVFFLNRLHMAGQNGKELPLCAANFRIAGGERLKDIRVVDALVIRPKNDEDDMVVLKVDQPGDFSCYTLEIVNAPSGTGQAKEKRSDDHRECLCEHEQMPKDILSEFDQRYRQASFSFKANCPSTMDCSQADPCVAPAPVTPSFSYLAKDYASFRDLILDRLALTMPAWRERHVPDLGIAVTEVLAYAADHLSYYQDAVAQEAYLGTARKRISVRRHARLVDYQLHEGCNARGWVCCDPDTVVTLQPTDFAVLTTPQGDVAKPLVFEPVKRLRSAELELGDFFDLRLYVAKLLLDIEVSRRLPNKLLTALQVAVKTNGPEAPIPADLAQQLIVALNERVLCDPTYSKEASVAPAGDLDAIRALNRAAFDEAHKQDCVAINGIYLNPAHARIQIYTWQNGDCCLEQDATDCVLVDGYATNDSSKQPRERNLKLRVGDVIIFEEVIGPQTGSSNDADPMRRHAVRLTSVEPIVDALTNAPLLRVTWSIEDALPLSFCLSKMGNPNKGCQWLTDISVVRGNVVLVDHGETLPPEDLGTVDREPPDYRCRCVGVLDEISVRAKPFKPALHAPGLTFTTGLNSLPSALKTLQQKPWEATPALELSSLWPMPDGSGPVFVWDEYEKLQTGELATFPSDDARKRAWLNTLPSSNQSSKSSLTPTGLIAKADHWIAKCELLKSSGDDRHFVVEMDDDTLAHIRFGSAGMGLAPQAGECFRAQYRTGSGPEGNVGHESITTFRPAQAQPTLNVTVRNPLAATGGAAPETLDEARRNAPHVFRKRQLRAITADDYARFAEKNPRVQRAGVEIVWSGARQCVRVALDPYGTTKIPDDLTAEVRDALLPFRRIGHDLEVIPATYASVDLVLNICVQAQVLRGDVEVAVRDALTSGLKRDGTPGFFHPDRLSFGEPVRISRIIAAVQRLPGVMSVKVDTLRRYGGHMCDELSKGYLEVAALEVARLDQDPNYPENGKLTLNIGGGR